MEEVTLFEKFGGMILPLLATSGAAAWIAAMLTNKRGTNKALDFIMDIIELIAGNINKAKNDKDA